MGHRLNEIWRVSGSGTEIESGPGEFLDKNEAQEVAEHFEEYPVNGQEMNPDIELQNRYDSERQDVRLLSRSSSKDDNVDDSTKS